MDAIAVAAARPVEDADTKEAEAGHGNATATMTEVLPLIVAGGQTGAMDPSWKMYVAEMRRELE